ncbi:hypothetical protein EG68_06129 [Paragonimus skrjabini miyazakii]|uniref:adenylate cyclase n=1 Tax=Paragonimus skrjabini miyazakii TaxID=59628 RepID=A0A8S9YN66_9TREM|nr:hypothetical protein EG68_06129 [Paragonimus skrjabini miyazakii]
MRAWYRGLHEFDENALHHHLFTDLFDENRSGFAVLHKYVTKIRKVLQLMEFQSNFINDYFCQLWLYRTKRQYRTVIKFFIIAVLMGVMEPGLLCPLGKVTQIYLNAIAVISFLLFYLFSFRQTNYSAYQKVALAASLLSIWTQLPIRCYIFSGNSPIWGSVFISVYAILLMLPINVELGLCIIVVYIVLVEAINITYDRETYKDTSSRLYIIYRTELWYMFDLSRITEVTRMLAPRTYKVVSVRAMVWLLICCSALYLRFWSSVRKRFAFFKLGHSVQARNQCHRAHTGSIHWIETIMPLQVSVEYQRLRMLNEHSDVTDWLYMRTFENVSILFADIVGFTKMSSKLTALQIVLILGDLMKKFDEVCELTHCEKLGTLGDCYYCMSGSQDVEVAHAVCCVEMGFHMCDILKAFNAERQHSVNIRVGIHTGIAHAAILGFERFRYDVYSYDVRIANELESTGRPGFIHISQATYDDVKDIYTVTVGPDLVVDKREQSFLLNQAAATVNIPTYFIEPQPRIGRMNSSYDKYAHPKKQSTAVAEADRSELSDLAWSSSESTKNSEGSVTESDSDSTETSGEWFEFELSADALADIKLSHQTNALHLKHDIALIQDLRSDPAKQHLLFQSPPVDALLLNFINPEIEWHYQRHLRSNIGPTFVDSEKLARVVDALVLLIVVLLLASIGMIATLGENQAHYYLGAILLAWCICATSCFTGLTYPDRIRGKWTKMYYEVSTNPLVRELYLGIFTFLPTGITLGYRWTFMEKEDPASQMYLYAAMNFISVLVHCIPSSSAAWARFLWSMISLVCVCMPTQARVAYFQEGRFCMKNLTVFNGIPQNKWVTMHTFQLLVCAMLVLVITRETERTCKLCFFVHREAQIESEAAEKAVAEANELLFNIVPDYVFEELKEIGKGDLTSNQGTLHYAVAHPMVGVSFISVSNFFTMIYREDLGGAERSLRLLHTIICTFDKLLHLPTTKDVEKIKSMNENYMVAAGLNRKEVANNADKIGHLCALMNYCFLLRKALYEIRVYDRAEMGFLRAKIGYNSGPVTAGIIGTTKLHYDIWGDTVNVASRMCYTSVPGPIQVPEDVKNLLKERFTFKYRGEFFVKGKGMMKTYTCEGRIESMDKGTDPP